MQTIILNFCVPIFPVKRMERAVGAWVTIGPQQRQTGRIKQSQNRPVHYLFSILKLFQLNISHCLINIPHVNLSAFKRARSVTIPSGVPFPVLEVIGCCGPEKRVHFVV
ncbi:hypothetical protein HanRHA438_Chr16g0777401 [Helianthus annuus]|nr:hypothetical protein HanRHA438_Chr16g0777401 [Helianthus annuus]